MDDVYRQSHETAFSCVGMQRLQGAVVATVCHDAAAPRRTAPPSCAAEASLPNNFVSRPRPAPPRQRPWPGLTQSANAMCDPIWCARACVPSPVRSRSLCSCALVFPVTHAFSASSRRRATELALLLARAELARRAPASAAAAAAAAARLAHGCACRRFGGSSTSITSSSDLSSCTDIPNIAHSPQVEMALIAGSKSAVCGRTAASLRRARAPAARSTAAAARRAASAPRAVLDPKLRERVEDVKSGVQKMAARYARDASIRSAVICCPPNRGRLARRRLRPRKRRVRSLSQLRRGRRGVL